MFASASTALERGRHLCPSRSQALFDNLLGLLSVPSPSSLLWPNVCEALDAWPAEDLVPLLPAIDAALLARPKAFPITRYKRQARLPAPVQDRSLPSNWLARIAAGEPLPQARLARSLTVRDHGCVERWTLAEWSRLVQSPDLDSIVWLTLGENLKDA
ncbi:MAG: hypothetical protein ACPG4T_08970, partial [Nannocystaceae bacterium]